MARHAKKTLKNRTDFSPAVLRKLDDAFSYGMSNKLACFSADVSESLFYEVCGNNLELSERFKLLQQSPKIKAVKNIVDAINSGSTNLSQWYLERKAKGEFGLHDLPGTPEEKSPIDLGREAMKRLRKYQAA